MESLEQAIFPIETRGPYDVLSRRTIYENPWIRVTEDTVIHPGGRRGVFGTIEVGRGRTGVGILPIDAKGNVALLREFLYARNEYGMEVAGGGVDPGEEVLAAAQRELKEELGVVADEWVDLGTIHHITTLVRASAHLYLARVGNLDITRAEPGARILIYPLTTAIEMVMDGTITASTTCTLLLKAARKLGV